MRTLIAQGLIGALFGCCATAVSLYVSLVTGIGPWMAPTLVLCAGVLAFLFIRRDESKAHDFIVMTQAIGSVGGTVATALGFSLPTIAFLEPELFKTLLAKPLYFIPWVAAITFAAGVLGRVVIGSMREELITDTQYRFPVSEAIYQTIRSHADAIIRRMLGVGIAITTTFSVLTEGAFSLAPVISRSYTLWPSIFGSAIVLEVAPFFWAIGFLVGMKIAVPLFVGTLTKYGMIAPLQYMMPGLSESDLVLSFATGMVVSQALAELPAQLIALLQRLWRARTQHLSLRGLVSDVWMKEFRTYLTGEVAGALAVSVAALSYYGFTVLQQAILIACTVLTTRALVTFMVKTGLAPYGRFMTFVMVPMMLAFALSYTQITLLCVYVAVAGAVACDLITQWKVGQLAGVSFTRISRAQFWGLVVAAIAAGCFFWILSSTLSLGSGVLAAHRGRSRALLLLSLSCHILPAIVGAVFSTALSFFGMNAMLVFGGLVMPNSITIGLLAGALLASRIENPRRFFPVCSGIFAGKALWVVAQLGAVLKALL